MILGNAIQTVTAAPLDVYDVARAHYERAIRARAEGDPELFPGPQLVRAREFAARLPHPYKLPLPTLRAFWLQHGGSWWYVVHDKVPFEYVAWHYLIPHADLRGKTALRSDPTVQPIVQALWEAQSDRLRASVNPEAPTGGKRRQGLASYDSHLPEATPIRMPRSAAVLAGVAPPLSMAASSSPALRLRRAIPIPGSVPSSAPSSPAASPSSPPIARPPALEPAPPEPAPPAHKPASEFALTVLAGSALLLLWKGMK